MMQSRTVFHAAAVLSSAFLSLFLTAELPAQDLGGNGPGDPITLETTVDATYEYRYRSADVMIEDGMYTNGLDLYRNVISVPPFAAADFDFGRKAGLAIGFGFELRKQFVPPAEGGTMFPTDNFLPIGNAGNPLATENSLITRGVLYWKSESLDLGFGRDQVDLGDGLRGSLYPSPRLPYLDAFRAKGRLGPLEMDWLVASIRDEESWDGFDVDPNEGVDLLHDPESYGFTGDPNPTAIIEALHRFTWQFGELRLGAAGHVMYARRNNRFVLTDFFPVIAWHQTDSLSNNLTMYVDASWTPFDGLRIMGMAGLDEVDARDVGVNDSGSPTVPAWVLGGEYKGRHGPGQLSLYLEAGYTHFLWGNFDGSNFENEDVNPLERCIYRMQLDAGAGLLPLTSPYGPGATWGLFSGAYDFNNSGFGFGIGLDILALSRMTAANLIATPVYTDAVGALTADSPRFLFIEVAIPLRFSSGNFEAYVAPALLYRDTRVWFEATVGATYRFAASSLIGVTRD